MRGMKLKKKQLKSRQDSLWTCNKSESVILMEIVDDHKHVWEKRSGNYRSSNKEFSSVFLFNDSSIWLEQTSYDIASDDEDEESWQRLWFITQSAESKNFIALLLLIASALGLMVPTYLPASLAFITENEGFFWCFFQIFVKNCNILHIKEMC